MQDIMFRNGGAIADNEHTVQAVGGGRSHVAALEGLRVKVASGVITLEGLRRWGPKRVVLAGCFLQIPTEDHGVIDLLITELERSKRQAIRIVMI